jgi:hypothetical protein
LGGQGPHESPRRGRQTEIKDKAGPGREQNGCKGFFPNSLRKEAHCYLEQKGEGTHPELLGKEEGKAEDWGKREFPCSPHEGLLVTASAQIGPS